MGTGWYHRHPHEMVMLAGTRAHGALARTVTARVGTGVIVATRKQSRRPDVRLHHRQLNSGEWIALRGLFVTRPARIASDLLLGHEGPEAVAQVVADAIRGAYDYPGTFADSFAPHAGSFGLRRGDGVALVRWLLDLVGDPETPRWMDEARAHVDRAAEREHPATEPAPTRRRR